MPHCFQLSHRSLQPARPWAHHSEGIQCRIPSGDPEEWAKTSRLPLQQLNQPSSKNPILVFFLLNLCPFQEAPTARPKHSLQTSAACTVSALYPIHNHLRQLLSIRTDDCPDSSPVDLQSPPKDIKGIHKLTSPQWMARLLLNKHDPMGVTVTRSDSRSSDSPVESLHRQNCRGGRSKNCERPVADSHSPSGRGQADATLEGMVS